MGRIIIKILKSFIALSLVGSTVALAVPADARQGCGMGSHRGPRGHCRPNVRGQFYAGQGYWDGHRFFQHRYRDHGGWRYR